MQQRETVSIVIQVNSQPFERVMTSADKRTVYSDPSHVTAVEGDVLLDGPDAVDVAMTPEAAEETSERLSDEAVKARGQRRLNQMARRPKD